MHGFQSSLFLLKNIRIYMKPCKKYMTDIVNFLEKSLK